jgi:hypothetical protein
VRGCVAVLFLKQFLSNNNEARSGSWELNSGLNSYKYCSLLQIFKLHFLQQLQQPVGLIAMSASQAVEADFLTERLAPMLGTLIGITMFASPLQAVLQARKKKSMGSLNPYPFGELTD